MTTKLVTTDVLVIGGGLAGERCAIEAAAALVIGVSHGARSVDGDEDDAGTNAVANSLAPRGLQQKHDDDEVKQRR